MDFLLPSLVTLALSYGVQLQAVSSQMGPSASDPTGDRVDNLKLACIGAPVLSGPFVGFLVDEEAHFNQDLNGDGEALDDVSACVELSTGLVSNFGLATNVDAVPFGRWVALSVNEVDQGGTDLNGDGAADDTVLHVVDLETGSARNVGIGLICALNAGAGRLVVRASEYMDGVDYDGDGQSSFKGILHVYDPMEDSLLNLAQAGTLYAASPQIEGLVFFAYDALGFPPFPVFALDAVSGTVQPMGISSGRTFLAWQTFVATPTWTVEAGEVADAWSGTGMVLSSTLSGVSFAGGFITAYDPNQVIAYDPLGGSTTALGTLPFSSSAPAADHAGGRIAWNDFESMAGVDWNGDGDADDAVLLVAAPFLSVLPLATSQLGLDGLARVSVGPLPTPAIGTRLFLQAGVVDPQARAGVALSAGLRFLIEY